MVASGKALKISSGYITELDAGDTIADGDGNDVLGSPSSTEIIIGIVYWPIRSWTESSTGSWTNFNNEFSIHDISDLQDLAPAGWTVKLRFMAAVRTQAGAHDAVRLYNVTDGVVVTNSVITIGGVRNSPEYLISSGLITLGSGSGEIDDDERIQPQYISNGSQTTGVGNIILYAVAVAP